MADGEIAADWTGGIAEGSVVLTDINETAAAAGTADKIATVTAGLKDGSVNVFDTKNFTVNGAAVAADHKADVDTDDKFTPDTAVVENGVFKESKFRSAPYFDLRIDGITLLNEKY
jgi:basic membrane protein A